MPIGGILGGLGSAIGGLFGSSAASDAAKQQADAIKQGIQLQRDIYNQTQQNLAPYIQQGPGALNALYTLFLSGAPGPFGASFETPINQQIGNPPSPSDPSLQQQFLASPGYQYQLQQSSDAIQNSAAGRSGAISGNMLKALQTNATGLASQDWNNFYSNLVQNYLQRYGALSDQRNFINAGLGGLVGVGQSAAANQGGLGNQFAASAASNLATLGSARAAGTLGSSNALSNTFSSLFGGGGSGSNPLSFLFGNSGSGVNSTVGGTPFTDYSGGGGTPPELTTQF